jgi:hypothetical protein
MQDDQNQRDDQNDVNGGRCDGEDSQHSTLAVTQAVDRNLDHNAAAQPWFLR